MNQQPAILQPTFILGPIIPIAFALRRLPCKLLVLLSLFSLTASAQNWSSFLDPSRAVDWSGAGFTIPSYSVNCSVQPKLLAGSSNASANGASIQNALNSCDSTHNVVSVPAGTFYTTGFHYGPQGKEVLRGSGASSTTLILTSEDSCAGLGHGVCMIAGNWTYSGDSSVQPPSGSRQCSWSGGYAKGSTSIMLSNCGGTPPVNQTLVLDQANDTSDTGGVYQCSGGTSNCTYEGAVNSGGRVVNGATYSLQQVVTITGVTSLGGGGYTATISPGVYSTNIRSSQNPGAWWPGLVQNDGIENLTLDGSSNPDGTLSMFSCYQCWVKGVKFLNGARNSILLYQSAFGVIRDSYFYGAQSHASTSYNIELDTDSGFLIENNIFQQVTTPMNFNGGATGNVVGYNFAVHNIFADGSWTWGIYASHDTGDNFNLFEGNDTFGLVADNASGPADQVTAFRNLFTGYQPGTTNTTVPFILRARNRIFNIVGNVLGQPGYHSNYQAFASSASAFSGAGSEYSSIYDLGGGGTGDVCSLLVGYSTTCDPLTYSTLMRWGNYDVVNGTTQWNSTEASPVSSTYLGSNFSSSYFSSLTHALPASLYYSSSPSWWPSGKNWPPIGPDVSAGNVGICTGTYAGAGATSASQCAGGTLSAAWASHATSIPAQDCYLSVLNGPPDGSGGALSFDASQCYGSSNSTGSTGLGSPVGLTSTAK